MPPVLVPRVPCFSGAAPPQINYSAQILSRRCTRRDFLCACFAVICTAKSVCYTAVQKLRFAHAACLRSAADAKIATILHRAYLDAILFAISHFSCKKPAFFAISRAFRQVRKSAFAARRQSKPRGFLWQSAQTVLLIFVDFDGGVKLVTGNKARFVRFLCEHTNLTVYFA